MNVPNGEADDPTLDELERWANSRALPEIEDKFGEGWEALRAQLLRWVEDRRNGSDYPV